MRFLFAALMLMGAIAAAASIPKQIRDAQPDLRKSGFRR